MKLNPAAIVVFCLSLVVLGFVSYSFGSTKTIEYRGEQIQLRKPYWSYDAYKADPNNLAPEELPRVEKMITESKLPANFKSREEFRRAVFDLGFPGYGVGNVGDYSQPDGSLLSLMYVEIPGVGKSRLFALQKEKEAKVLNLIDSPVLPVPANAVAKLSLEGKNLKYLDKAGTALRDTQLP